MSSAFVNDERKTLFCLRLYLSVPLGKQKCPFSLTQQETANPTATTPKQRKPLAKERTFSKARKSRGAAVSSHYCKNQTHGIHPLFLNHVQNMQLIIYTCPRMKSTIR